MSDTNPATNLEPASDTNTGTIPELTDAEKLDYIYQVAVRLGEIVYSITDEQVQQVKKVYQNPMLRKLLGG